MYLAPRKNNIIRLFMRCILLIFTFCNVFCLSVFARNDTIQLGRSFGLQISGFARIDYIYDTRQTSEAVEGLFTFYPLNKQVDANGDDINAVPRTNLSSISSRLCTNFFAPDVLGAKSSAYIEFDFTGTSNTNGIRMRQAWVNLAWEKSNLLLGRTWHPVAASCIPNVIALNTGAPFWAFNRSDQLRFDFKPGQWLLSAIALYQSDYASLGPAPGTTTSVKSPTYLRDALLPEFAVNIAYKAPKFQTGVVGSVKTIKPRQYTTAISNGLYSMYKTDEKLTTYVAQAFAQYQSSGWVFKAQATYAQNTTESLMIGGYAVSAFDPQTGHESYTPTKHMNYWVNIDYGKKCQVGIFAGYLNSLGTIDPVVGDWYARAPNIKYMYRISPHVFYSLSNWQFGAEFEYTAAAFGTIEPGSKGKVVGANEVANLRTNLLLYFFF